MKNLRKIVGRIEKFFIFGVSKCHKRVVMPEERPGFFCSPPLNNSVITPWIDRNSPSKPSCGALTPGSVTLIFTVTQSQKPQDMKEIAQIKAEADRIKWPEPDSFIEILAEIDPFGYRDLLLAIPS